MSARGPLDLLFIGDVHLDQGERAVEEFCRFLDAVAPTTSRIVLGGDLFNLWLGRRELERPHQRRVLSALQDLRRQGIVVRYLEGNRDYRIGPAYAGSALDDASETGIVERHGGLSLFAVHGDRVNEEDRRYRAWRRLSRSRLVWALFNALPAARRLRLAERIETRLRNTNLDYKRKCPEDAVRRFAAGPLGAGHDVVVLGHFHVELHLVARPPSPPGRILVLPEWKESRRHLRVGSDGDLGFVDSPR